jgi:hypothetical protein
MSQEKFAYQIWTRGFVPNTKIETPVPADSRIYLDRELAVQAKLQFDESSYIVEYPVFASTESECNRKPEQSVSEAQPVEQDEVPNEGVLRNWKYCRACLRFRYFRPYRAGSCLVCEVCYPDAIHAAREPEPPTWGMIEAMAVCDTSAALSSDAPEISMGDVGKLARAYIHQVRLSHPSCSPKAEAQREEEPQWDYEGASPAVKKAMFRFYKRLAEERGNQLAKLSTPPSSDMPEPLVGAQSFEDWWLYNVNTLRMKAEASIDDEAYLFAQAAWNAAKGVK